MLDDKEDIDMDLIMCHVVEYIIIITFTNA